MLLRNSLLDGGRYRIVECVGEGGQGSVYKALTQGLDSIVAVKEAEMKSPYLRQIFKREGRRLAKLRHPALPKGFAYFEERGHQYLVMEYIEGLDLAKQLQYRGQPFPVGDVLKWADDLLEVLVYLHSQQPPLIHRDIKPANLKMTPNGQIILLDFGIATGGLTEVTIQKKRPGFTPGYAPPEQENGAHTDERTDIYAVGATLYHLLTNTPPTRATRRQHPDPVRPANELNSQVPSQLANLLARAMALDPAQRFATAAEMRAMLAQIKVPNSSGRTSQRSSPPQARSTFNTNPTPPTQPTQPTQPTFPTNYTNSQPPVSPFVVLWRRLIALAVSILLAVIVIGAVLMIVDGAVDAPSVTATVSQTVTPTPVILAATTSTPADVPTEAPAEAPPATPTKSSEPPSEPTTDLPVLVGTPIAPPVAAISPSNAQQVVQLARWGKGQIQEVTYSPDGTVLAAASTLGIYLYDAETIEQIALIESNNVIASVAFSPDGQMLASGSWSDPTVRLWRVSDGTLLANFEGHERASTVNRVAFSSDGQRLASAANDGTVRLWNVSDGTLLHTLSGHTGGVTTVAFSPDGQRVVSGSYDQTVRVWQVSDGNEIYTLTGHTDWVRDVAFNPSGQIIASSSQDGIVRVWQGQELLYSLSNFAGRVESVAFSPDGQLLATGSYFDEEVSVWRVEDGTLRYTLQQLGVSDVGFSPDGQSIVTLYWGHSLAQWQQVEGESDEFTRFNDLTEHTNGMTSVAISDNGAFVASGSYDQRVRLWRVSDNTRLYRLGGHSERVSGVAFSGDVSKQEIPFLASGARDQTVLLRRGEEIIGTLEGHEGEVMSVDFTTDGETIASGAKDGTVHLWRQEELLHTLEGHSEEVTSVAFSEDGQIVISGSKDKSVKVWQVADGTRLNALREHSDTVESVAVAQNGQLIAAGLKDGTVVIWQDGTQLGTLEGHGGSVNGVSFTPDGQLLASASEDATIRLWKIEDRALLHTLEAHNLSLTGVAFSADGQLLASSSDDGTVRLWGVR